MKEHEMTGPAERRERRSLELKIRVAEAEQRLMTRRLEDVADEQRWTRRKISSQHPGGDHRSS
jgi:hypothetical protein